MKNVYKLILISLISIIAIGNVVAQKKPSKKSTKLRLEYVKNFNDEETLVASLIVKEKSYIPLKNVEVLFYSMNDTSSTLLDKIKTNENGQAVFLINNNPSVFKDSLGQISIEVEYQGDEKIKGAKRKIVIKQATLEVSFFQKDTVKYIEVELSEIAANDQIMPIENLGISFYIKGTFSQLNFGKEKTDKNGKVKIEFPIDMPGDTNGVLTIIAKIEEDDMYGTVESRGEINWAVPVPLAQEKQRGLGDTDAPLWMVYTLITLLSAVWFHYLYVVFMIVKIKLTKSSL